MEFLITMNPTRKLLFNKVAGKSCINIQGIVLYVKNESNGI